MKTRIWMQFFIFSKPFYVQHKCILMLFRFSHNCHNIWSSIAKSQLLVNSDWKSQLYI